MITSYIADILEAEDLLSVRRGNRTTLSCHMCDAKIEDLPVFSWYEKEAGREMKVLYTSALGTEELNCRF